MRDPDRLAKLATGAGIAAFIGSFCPLVLALGLRWRDLWPQIQNVAEGFLVLYCVAIPLAIGAVLPLQVRRRREGSRRPVPAFRWILAAQASHLLGALLMMLLLNSQTPRS